MMLEAGKNLGHYLVSRWLHPPVRGTYLDLTPFSAYDVTPDGQRFVMFPGPAENEADGGMAVTVFNWLRELEE